MCVCRSENEIAAGIPGEAKKSNSVPKASLPGPLRRALYLPRNESSLWFQGGQVLITHSQRPARTQPSHLHLVSSSASFFPSIYPYAETSLALRPRFETPPFIVRASNASKAGRAPLFRSAPLRTARLRAVALATSTFANDYQTRELSSQLGPANLSPKLQVLRSDVSPDTRNFRATVLPFVRNFPHLARLMELVICVLRLCSSGNARWSIRAENPIEIVFKSCSYFETSSRFIRRYQRDDFEARTFYYTNR